MSRIQQLYGNSRSSQGFTLLEIALALAILSVVAIYTLDMYQSISSRKKLVDDRGRMGEISTGLKAYYSGHESLPPAATMGTINNVLPVADLGLGQSYRFDTHGRPYLYFPATTASGFQVDGKAAAGVVISLGEDQIQLPPPNDYVSTSPVFNTNGDDTLVSVEVNVEAVAIALAELETLGKRVEAYNREFAGIQNDVPVTNYYGDTTAGAPPIIDPDEYDAQYLTWPQLYPYNPYYPTFPDVGPPPTDEDLAYDQPDNNWPPVPNTPIYVTWPARPPDPPTNPDLPPGFAGWSAPGPGFPAWPFGTDVFGEYNPVPIEEVADSYELIDEGGCSLVGGDPNCAFADLDDLVTYPNPEDPVNFIVNRYGLGTSLQADPWGNPYQWGRGLLNTDPQYHLFFSAGPDGIPGTTDDVLLF